MMEIFWTMLASQDRKRIREYIAEQNLMAAIELDERIGYSASSLAGQPYKGRNGRVGGRQPVGKSVYPARVAYCTEVAIEGLSGYKEMQ